MHITCSAAVRLAHCEALSAPPASLLCGLIKRPRPSVYADAITPTVCLRFSSDSLFKQTPSIMLRAFFPDFLKRWFCPIDVSADLEMQARPEWRPMIEDYRPGYPQFSALISSTDDFFVFRRFKRLRARLLLLKQDKITVLEQKLDQLDRDESNDLFLCINRSDKNPERESLLMELEQSLAGYGRQPAHIFRPQPRLRSWNHIPGGLHY